MKTLHRAEYHPPRSDPPKVTVVIELDPENVDREHPIPRWRFRVEITTEDFRGVARAAGGTVEAMTEEQAKLRVYSEAIDCLAELLAERIKTST